MQRVSSLIALVQMKSSEDKEENLKLSLNFIKEASKKNADLICFPEFQMAFSPSDQSAKQLMKLSESVNRGNFVFTLCSAAKRNTISVIATIYERYINNSNAKYKNRVFDTAIMKEEHWQTMLKARAIENGSYVIAPDQVGNIFSGRSMVVDPFGISLLDMGN